MTHTSAEHLPQTRSLPARWRARPGVGVMTIAAVAKLDHAMAAYTLANKFTGPELGTTWSYPEKRSSFVGSFHYND